MPKKYVKKTPKLDMNPMVDMAFLLVSFFMLTTTFKTEEPILIQKPTSQTEVKLPESNVVTLTVSEAGTLFFSMDGKFSRRRVLELMGERYEIPFSESELNTFSLISSVGLPMAEMQAYLQQNTAGREAFPQTGIPFDSLRNELNDWIVFARISNPRVRFAINGDQEARYPVVKKVIQTLIDNNIHRFNLLTDLEAS